MISISPKKGALDLKPFLSMSLYSLMHYDFGPKGGPPRFIAPRLEGGGEVESVSSKVVL
jgi:hypothetical protein